MVLDSVALLDRPDPFGARLLARLPATLGRFCAGGACTHATPDFPRDVVTLANRIAGHPLSGSVRRGDGGRMLQMLGAENFVALVLEADLSPGLAAELPAATRAALTGNPKPLLRLAAMVSPGVAAQGLSSAAHLATTCHDGRFPWTPGTPVAERPAVLERAVAALAPSALGGFGSWAARLGDAYACLGWPAPAGGTTLATRPPPDVPVLVLSGDFDLRTPTDDARALVREFPRGRLVVFPGIGHSVLTNDGTGCAIGAVRDWLSNPAFRLRAGCPRKAAFLSALPAFPAGAPATSRSRTLELAEQTLHDAVAVWMMVGFAGRFAVAGLEDGTAVTSLRKVSLRNYAIAPGVLVSGDISLSTLPPFRFSGVLTVAGERAAKGTVVLDGVTLRGRLAGKPVGRPACFMQC
jgi:hypothetical protein